MENLNLNADIRTTEEKLSEVRASSKVPAVVYGKNQEPILLKMDNSDFLKTFRKSWESTIINLKAGKEKIEVLVHQIQREPISGDFLHVDFYAITRGQKLTTKISINFIWESQAVKEGGVLEEQLKEIEVKVLPKNLVDHFDADLSSLKEFGDTIKVSDINIDTEIFEVLTNEWVIASVSQPKIEVIPEEAPESELPEWAEEETEEGSEEEKKED